MNPERKPRTNPKIARTVAANLIMEGGAQGNLENQPPVVRKILKGLEDIPLIQIKEVLVFLSNGSSL